MKYDMLQERRTPTHKILHSIASEGTGDSTAGYPTQWVSGMKEIGGWRKQTTPEIALWNLSGPQRFHSGVSILLDGWPYGMESWEEPDAHSNDTRHCTVESLGARGGAGAGDSTLVSPTWSVGGVTGQDPEEQACTLRRHRKTALWNLWGPGPGGPGDSIVATPKWWLGGVAG